MERLRVDGEAILRALRDLRADLKAVPQREARRKAKLDDNRFRAAVAFLQEKAPSSITVGEAPYHSGTGGLRKKSMLGLRAEPKTGGDDAPEI